MTAKVFKAEKDLIKVGTDAGLSKAFCVECLNEIQDKIEVLGQYLGKNNFHKVSKIPPAERIAEITGKKS